jgi:hypothetical protein
MADITAGHANVKINVDYQANIVQVYRVKIDEFVKSQKSPSPLMEEGRGEGDKMIFQSGISPSP